MFDDAICSFLTSPIFMELSTLLMIAMFRVDLVSSKIVIRSSQCHVPEARQLLVHRYRSSPYSDQVEKSSQKLFMIERS